MRLNCTCVCNNDIKEQPKHHGIQQNDEIAQGYPVIAGEQYTQCLLCQKQVNHNNTYIKTKCNHEFCLDCFIHQSKKKGNTYCPWCNRLLYTMKLDNSATKQNDTNKIILEINELTTSIKETIKSM